MGSTKISALLAAIVLGGTAVSQGAVVLSIVETQVVKGTESKITIFASATDGESVRGLELTPKINDGGIANGGSATRPPIVAVPSISGTVWPAGTTVDQPVPISSFPLFPQFSFATPTLISASLNGIVAVLTVDTSAMSTGSSFTIDLTDNMFPSYFTTDSGQIAVTDTPAYTVAVVVPEPASLAILGGSALMLLRRRRA